MNDKFDICIINSYTICISGYQNDIIYIFVTWHKKGISNEIFILVEYHKIVRSNLSRARFKISRLFYLTNSNVNKRANLQNTIDRNNCFLDILYFVCHFSLCIFYK